jgi:protein-tyrosine phosphatase
MNWITDFIAIGNNLEAQNETLLSQNRFRAVLTLDGTLSEHDPEDLGHEDIVAIELKDRHGNDPATFRRAIMSLADMVTNSPAVLVQCHAGRSRSVIVVAGYLVLSLRIRPIEAVPMIACMIEINISQGMENLLSVV